MVVSPVFLVDVLVVVTCGAVVIVKGGAAHSHPAVIYLTFHLLVVTSRVYAIDQGAPTFLSGIGGGYEGVTKAEIYRAVAFADIALIAATIGWMSARKRFHRGHRPHPDNKPIVDPLWRPLRYKYVLAVVVIALPVGSFVFFRYGYVPGVGTDASSSSSYVTFALTWPGLVLIALVYCRGFKLSLLIPLTLYLGVIALQGYSRFRLVVPVILLVQIYLDRRHKRWPDLRVASILVVSLLLFFPLKAIGRAVQSGEGLTTIRSASESSVSDALAGQSGDQVILDELAVTLSLTDASNRIFAGRPYLSFLTLPIPRQIWDRKPGLADHLKVISTPSRPLYSLGTVTTLPGDLYLNFRLPGLILFMFLLARWSAILYEAAYRRPYRSVGRFAYLLFSCNLVQTYRDGFISIPFFLLVQMFPLVVILIVHWRRPDARGPSVNGLIAAPDRRNRIPVIPQTSLP